jgi:long-chain acyl-CoA synthetase
MPVHERFAAEAWTAPHRPALVIDGRTLTYGALYARIRQAAARLAADTTRGDRIGLLLPNSGVFVVLMLGALTAGLVPVILDPAWSDAELAAALTAVRPRAVFTRPEHAKRLRVACPVEVVGSLTSDSWQSWLAGPAARGSVRASDSAPLFIGFTSGTSGRPKPYLRSHASWLASIDAARHEFGAATDGVLIPGPLAYSLSLYALIETLVSGGTATLMSAFNAQDALAILAGGGIRRIHGVPTIYAALVEAADAERLTCPAVASVLVTGAALPAQQRAALRRIFPAAAVHSYYGASELSFVAVARDGEAWPETSVGRPFSGVTLAVRRDDGEEAAPGEVGRLFVHSAFLCDGHLGPAEDTGFVAIDGWATVGDLGYCDAAGFVHLTGRHGGKLISGGQNLYPAEVEAVLGRLPEVAQAVVLALPDAYWGEQVCAVVRWREGRTLPRAALREACRQQLAPWKCPQRFFSATALPMTSSGKVAIGRLQRELTAQPPVYAEIA